MKLSYPKGADGMYILSRYDIENIAAKVLNEQFPMNLEKPIPLNTEALFDNLGLIVKHRYLGIPEHEILGVTIMGDLEELVGCNSRMEPVVFEETFGTVLINIQLCNARNRARRRYTEAHEASHWLLHRPYFDRLPQDKGSRHIVCRSVENYRLKRRTITDWLEWQADSLAASLLMPRDIFFRYVQSAIRSAGIPKGYLVEGQGIDRNVFREIIDPISKQFSVSHRAAQIRMVHLNLIKTASAA